VHIIFINLKYLIKKKLVVTEWGPTWERQKGTWIYTMWWCLQSSTYRLHGQWSNSAMCISSLA